MLGDWAGSPRVGLFRLFSSGSFLGAPFLFSRRLLALGRRLGGRSTLLGTLAECEIPTVRILLRRTCIGDRHVSLPRI